MGYNDALSLMRRGRANPSNYHVMFPSKVLQLLNYGAEMQNYGAYFCRAATLPGINNSVLSIRGQENTGIQRNVITGRGYGSPAVFTFSERSDLLVYQHLKSWMDSSMIGSEQRTDSGRSRNLRSNYYHAMKSDVLIVKMEANRLPTEQRGSSRNDLVTGIWTLQNAIPLALEQVTMSVEGSDSLLDFTLSLAFESFDFKPLYIEESQFATALNIGLERGNESAMGRGRSYWELNRYKSFIDPEDMDRLDLYLAGGIR